MEIRSYQWVLSSDQPEHKDFDFNWFLRSSDYLTSLEFQVDEQEILLWGFPRTPLGESHFTEANTNTEFMTWRDGDSFERFESGEVCVLEGDDGYHLTLMRVVPDHTKHFFTGRNWHLPSELLTEALIASAHRLLGGVALSSLPPRAIFDGGTGDHSSIRFLEFSTGLQVWARSIVEDWAPRRFAHSSTRSRWLNPEKAVAAGALWDAGERHLELWEPLLLPEGAEPPAEEDWWRIYS